MTEAPQITEAIPSVHPFRVSRSDVDWARLLDCSVAEARRALDSLVAKGLIVEVANVD